MSITTKWILTLVILVILLVGIAVYYTRQQDRHDKLSEDLDKAQQTLIANSQQKGLLQYQLDLANLAYAEGLAVFPDASQSMDMEQALYGAAAESGVEITTLSCSSPTAAQAGGYQVFAVSLGVDGQVEALLRFTAVLGYWLPSADIASVSMNTLDGGSGTLSMSLKVYALEAG
ncbi:MAG: hypothetical protein FJ020_03990 [Chloroflexi bacterium]|nr:hypothetical protein [Chloroflexota bacterium]